MLGTQLNQYRIDEMLGQSGSSAVYKAYDQLLMRDVALRVIRPARPLESEEIERYKRETLAVARFHGGPVCQVFEVDTFDKEGETLLFVVMEYIPGPSLKASVKQGGLDTAAVTRLAKELAQALKVLHSRGAVHRHLTPGNVMFDGEGRLKLMDAGPAAFAEDPFDSETYAAPELDAGQEHDERSDIYSLGVILYELATGAPPIGAPRVEPPLPTELNPGLSLELEAVILKCLFANPLERFKNVDELIGALSAPRATPKTAVEYWEIDGKEGSAREDPFTALGASAKPQAPPPPAPRTVSGEKVDKSLVPPKAAFKPPPGPGLGRTLGFALIQVAIAALILGGVLVYREYWSKSNPPPETEPATEQADVLVQPDLPDINPGAIPAESAEKAEEIARAAERPIGYLSIAGIEPETAEVYVDGIWRERPVRRLELMSGPHELEVRHDGRQVRRTVTIIAGEINWLEKISLERGGSARKPAAPAPKGRGMLSVRVSPAEATLKIVDSDVRPQSSYIDKALSTCELAEGDYNLDVTADGHRSRLVGFSIEDSKTTELEITLERLTHLLSITASPPGASITISDLAGGDTLRVKGVFLQTLPEGRYLVKVSASGYLTLETNITLKKDESLTLSLTPSG